jgi:hypothetical protein
VAKREDANSLTGVKGFLITNRDSKCSIDPESITETTRALWEELRAGTQRTLQCIIGTEVGNRVLVQATVVATGVSYGDRAGIRTQPVSYSIERATLDTGVGAEIALKFY